MAAIMIKFYDPNRGNEDEVNGIISAEIKFEQDLANPL
jgi:hypothetical protein